MARIPAKSALKQELLQRLVADLETAERAQKAASEGATHEEARPEHDKDTRAVEQSYLARGQARRVEELRAAVAEVRAMTVEKLGAKAAAALGALVEVDEDGEPALLFLAPHGGGTALAGGKVQVVTPRSPLGQALVDKHVGDAVEVFTAGRTRELELLKVS